MALAQDLNIPAALLASVQLQPAQAVFKAILSTAIAPIPVHIALPTNPTLPFVLVRRLPGMGDWNGDSRGLADVARMAIHVYADGNQGVNAEYAALTLSEIIRVKLREAWQAQWSDPALGALVKLRMTSEPSRVSDWATSSGPVQYADLPAGTWRYESHYMAVVRPPLHH